MLKSLQNTTKIAKKLNQQSATLLNAAKKQKRTRFDYTLSCSFEVSQAIDSSFSEKVKATSKLGETTTTEVYYDKVPAVLQANKVPLTNTSPLFASTPDYSLGRRDSWLKLVNGKNWELKFPFKNEQNANKTHLDLDPKTTQRTPMYMLAVGEKGLRRELNLQQDATAENNNTLEQDLRERGIVPFATIKLVQETFAYNDAKKITVDIITTDFGYKYSIVKIRLPNCRQLDIDANLPAYEATIDELGFAEQRTAKKSARDAVKEYIARNLKDYYRFLVDNNIVQDS